MTLPFLEDDVQIVDRSTLEPYAVCPRQGWFLANGVKKSGECLDVGTEVHAIVSAAVAERQENGAQPRELRDTMVSNSFDSRPDVQPRVSQVIRSCNWPVSMLLCFKPSNNERHPDDILKYDGGKDARAGQIAHDLELDGTTYRLTCELDLLLATDSPEELDYYDWKSGWTHWTATDVKNSFQFQFYVFLIFANFPSVQRVRVRVFMCGEGSSTGVVEFEKKDMYASGRRIETALKLRAVAMSMTDASKVDAWPESDRCAICPAAIQCAAASKDDVDIAVDPAAYLNRYVILSTAEAAMKANLTKWVRKTGADLESGVNAFGVNKPRAVRAATCDLYSVPTGEDK